MLKQLGDQDASYLYLETAETPQHVGGLNFIELPPDYPHDFFEVYKAHIKSRLHLVPFLHSKLLELPFDLDRPFWLEDDHVDIDYHVRHETLPRPGTMKDLEDLVGRLHSSLLDRTRPLWEFHVIDGLESGNIAIYTKIHHAAMDGASSQALVVTMYDPSPAPRAFPGPSGPAGQTSADFESVVQGVLAHFVRQEIRAAQFLPELMKTWTNLLLPNMETLRYERLPKTPSTPGTLFNVGITNQRLYAARTLCLSALKKLGKATGTTVNDVVLAVCSGALRNYLVAKDALPAQPMTTMVPVSARNPGESDAANHNAMFVCSLATDHADPYERLLAIHASALEQKKRLDHVKSVLFPDLAVWGQGGLMRHLVELYGRAKLAQRLPLLANLTISNVPGPPVTLYLAGLRVQSLYPCSIPFHGSALNITVQSYGDRLDFGLIACRRTVPDLHELADGLDAAWNELQQSVLRHLAEHAPELSSLQPSAATVTAAASQSTSQATAEVRLTSDTKPATAPKPASDAQPTASAPEPSVVATAKPARPRRPASVKTHGHDEAIASRTRTVPYSDIVALKPKRAAAADSQASTNRSSKRKKAAAAASGTHKAKKSLRSKRALSAHRP